MTIKESLQPLFDLRSWDIRVAWNQGSKKWRGGFPTSQRYGRRIVVTKTYNGKYPAIVKAAATAEGGAKALAVAMVKDQPFSEDTHKETKETVKAYYEDVAAVLAAEGVSYAIETLSKFRKVALWVQASDGSFPWVDGYSYSIHEAARFNTSEDFKTLADFEAWVGQQSGTITTEMVREHGKSPREDKTLPEKVQSALKNTLSAVKKVDDADEQTAEMNEVADALADIVGALRDNDLDGALNPAARHAKALAKVNDEVDMLAAQVAAAPEEAKPFLGTLLADAKVRQSDLTQQLGVSDMTVRRGLAQAEVQTEVPVKSLSAITN